MKRSRTAAATTVAAAALVLLGATGASAHVTVTADTTEAGSYAVLTVSVPHGCGDSATTAVAIAVPESIPAVTPTVNPGWEIEKVMETLDPPVDDGHGGQLTERVAQVVYTARSPLPADHRDAMELSVRLPDTPGETLAFPVVQTCEEGEAPWVQLAAEGQDPDELEYPASVLTLTAAAQDEPAAVETADGAAAADATGDDGAAEAASPPAAVSWAALALGAAGLALGGVALARTRRTS
ncbi:YcnI family copper-binding membrane protein [Oceanitalea stevensii]|uniref:YcnI family protein n=1 Tax=Oceanitalea stevensii TaxID=2763072 RepID=A0ABR8YZG2_9MICO|nr:YcnI family protein [Oceanitalea stevensii]MBD8061466.1 YcnI family protein [Oceanitalea stevensii]